MNHDLMLTNVFTSPVTLTAIDVLSPEGELLLHLAGDSLLAVTGPLLEAAPTVVIPASGAVATVIDVVVPPDAVPERLSHRLTYRLEPDAPAASLISSLVIDGPEAILDPFAPVVIAPPLRGSGWVNANGCCGPSAHRSTRLVIGGSHIVNFEMFAIDWVRVEDGRLYTGDGTRNEDHFAFGADVLAVADGTVVACTVTPDPVTRAVARVVAVVEGPAGERTVGAVVDEDVAAWAMADEPVGAPAAVDADGTLSLRA